MSEDSKHEETYDIAPVSGIALSTRSRSAIVAQPGIFGTSSASSSSINPMTPAEPRISADMISEAFMENMFQLFRARLDAERANPDPNMSSSSSSTLPRAVAPIVDEQRVAGPLLPFGANAVPALIPIPVFTRVPQNEHRITQPHVIDAVFKLKMKASNMHQHSINFLRFQELLQTCSLHSLANGSRPYPQPTAVNPTGFVPDRTSKRICAFTGHSVVIIVERDDLAHHIHDLTRLMSLLRILIDEEIVYIFQKQFDAINALELFKALASHVNGQSANDIIAAQNQLRKWRIDSRVPFAKDAAALLELYRRLEHAKGSPTPDEEKFCLISSLITDDPRPALLNAFQHCTNARFSFAATIDNMVEQMNRQPANGATSTLGKMARFEKTAGMNICFDFQKGKCTRGDKCPYKHVIDPDFKPRPSNRKPNPTTASAIAGPLTRDYRQDNLTRVGPGVRPVSDKNPFGHSKIQC